MLEDRIYKAFHDLGIHSDPLPEYYTPDLYAKKLMASYNKRKSHQVIFSSTIEYTKN